ncbi:MAG: hypothetical protein EOP10_08945 [Proteobacteria bacterium]|nr:MAG: hypothetical protein EOP10_08945 [Pseudomonadota bacterium]
MTITSGGKARKFFLTIPSNYNPKVPMPVVFGFHGRDYDGIRMRDYLDLEKFGEWALFVYPDALSRNWQGDTFIGWQNGPLGGKFGGGEDLIFVDDMIAYMKKRFCTDTKNYFATGQSWGGDFSNVVGCYKGSSFRAILPVAANGAYYLPKDAKSGDCTGNPAAWPMHSKTDEYFPVKLGEEYRDFWLKRNSCSQETTKLPINDDCFEYKGCAQSTRWCLYTGNHQVPRSYYSSEAVKFFRGFVGK